MKKCDLNKDTYFIGENSSYLEIKNVKEYIDIDGIKRYLVEVKDINKIHMIKKQSIINQNPSVEKDDEDFGKDKIVM